MKNVSLITALHPGSTAPACILRVMNTVDISLNRFERQLMSFYKRSGTRGVVVLVTSVSVLISTVITMGLIYPLSSPSVADEGFWYFLGAGIGVPLVVAPIATLCITRLLSMLDRSFQIMHSLSTTDPLTGSANRRGFFSLAEQNIRALRGQNVCGVGMVDLNDFKILNDTYGHNVGDAALVTIAAQMQEIIGDAGSVGRIGGDEFALLIIDKPERVESIGAELVQRCSKLVFKTNAGADAMLSASVGIVQLEDDESFDRALSRADALLYDKKRARRSRSAAVDRDAN